MVAARKPTTGMTTAMPAHGPTKRLQGGVRWRGLPLIRSDGRAQAAQSTAGPLEADQWLCEQEKKLR